MKIHVAAVMRFDDDRAHKLLGPKPHIDAGKDIPTGADGVRLAVQIYENPDLASVAAYTVTVHGDLDQRFDQAEADVMNYLNNLTWMREVRNGVCQIRGEHKHAWSVWHYHNPVWKELSL